MRLLLDEMYPAAVAEQLRRRGHDAVAVTERRDLRALADPQVFAEAQAGRRAVVTENVADFARIAEDADRRGASHQGLVLVDAARFPRGRPATIGRLVRALDQLLRDFPDDEPTGARHWL